MQYALIFRNQSISFLIHNSLCFNFDAQYIAYRTCMQGVSNKHNKRTGFQEEAISAWITIYLKIKIVYPRGDKISSFKCKFT